MKTATSFVIALAVALAAAPAHAQTAEAEALFREGKRLMKKGEIAEACDKFEASERLEPTVGTELNLADCREKNGQTASAWAMFVKAAAGAKRADDDKRASEARRRADALDSKLVYLTIEVPEDSRVDELVIKRNDVALDAAQLDQRVPVDPGDYTISAEAPGYKRWSERVTVRTKNKKIEVPPLEKKQRKARDADEEDREPVDAKPAPRRRFTAVAITLGVVGLGAAGAGVGFGLAAKDLESRSDNLCPTTDCADPAGIDLNKRARRDALFANIGFVAGGVAIAGAVALLVVGTPEHDNRVSVVPTVSSDQVGFALGGTF
ncbi:MAG: hypothetical protein HOV81_02150 [Kofleriaceae bacterium]|nr:hypothetical protein [Kofleriaceae bacterium]